VKSGTCLWTGKSILLEAPFSVPVGSSGSLTTKDSLRAEPSCADANGARINGKILCLAGAPAPAHAEPASSEEEVTAGAESWRAAAPPIKMALPATPRENRPPSPFRDCDRGTVPIPKMYFGWYSEEFGPLGAPTAEHPTSRGHNDSPNQERNQQSNDTKPNRTGGCRRSARMASIPSSRSRWYASCWAGFRRRGLYAAQGDRPPLAAAAHAGGTPSLEARRIWCVFQFSWSAPASAAHGRAENVAIPGDEEVIG